MLVRIGMRWPLLEMFSFTGQQQQPAQYFSDVATSSAYYYYNTKGTWGGSRSFP